MKPSVHANIDGGSACGWDAEESETDGETLSGPGDDVTCPECIDALREAESR